MESNSILIENTLILDGEKMEKGSILIENDKIRELSKDINKKEADKVIDGSKKIVIPGMVNTHTHLSMTLLRGLADDLDLDTWLNDHIWPMEASLNEDYCYAGALLGCMEMIKSGTTTFNDMYFYMEDVARAVEESGLRCILSHGMIDLGDAHKRKEEFKKTHHLIEKCHNSASGRIQVAYGPHSPYTCSEELLKQVREEATKKGISIHIHVGETRTEVQQVTDAQGKRPFEYLDEIGFLKEDVLAAHGVWLSSEEINIIKKRKVNLSHNPASNMKLASGVSPVDQLIKNEVVVGLGTDGAASNNNLDMLEEMKLAALLQKAHTLDPTSLPAEKVFQMATIQGASALGMEKEIGTIKEGKKADLAIINIKTSHLTPFRHPLSHLVYSAQGGDVDTVICNGNILMENRNLQFIKENQVLELAENAAEEMLSKN